MSIIMRVTFNPAKNARNRSERGLSFERVADLGWETAVVWEDRRQDYGEQRCGTMAGEKDDRASHPDDQNPEWTREDFLKARPAFEVFADVFGQEAAEMLRRGRGRPVKADKKVNQTLRRDADMLEPYRQSGSGWQALMNRMPREPMPARGK
jgi:uncharacterized protein (DUF4415 family)